MDIDIFLYRNAFIDAVHSRVGNGRLMSIRPGIIFDMEFFHVINRGIDNRLIALDDKDRLRFVHSLFELNDVMLVDPNHRLRDFDPMRKRETLVAIHAWCLMPNHYHLLLSESVEDGISRFMKKMNMGYAKYFNQRHQRMGALWQGKAKMIKIKRDENFHLVPKFIHLNPLDMSAPNWRRGKVSDPKSVVDKLRAYRWSSHLDYAGESNFPSIVRMGIVRDSVGDRYAYEKGLRDVLSDPEIAQHSMIVE